LCGMVVRAASMLRTWAQPACQSVMTYQLYEL
jgi:hypothetical protein